MAIPPFDVTIKGVALNTYGLTSWDVYSGLGLLTDGLIWPCPEIWYGPINSPGTTTIMTTWSLIASPVTSWTLSPGQSTTTVWVDFSTYNIEDC